MRVDEKDVSSARVAAYKRPNLPFNEIMNRIRGLQAIGADADTIQMRIGPVPELSGDEGDLLAISSIEYVCQTAQPIWAKFAQGVGK